MIDKPAGAWCEKCGLFRTATTFVQQRLFKVKCPDCGGTEFSECDIVPGDAGILGVYEDGRIEWNGGTEVDWDGQRPASNPPEFRCLGCNLFMTQREFLDQKNRGEEIV